jgi:hypothetical protein
VSDGEGSAEGAPVDDEVSVQQGSGRDGSQAEPSSGSAPAATPEPAPEAPAVDAPVAEPTATDYTAPSMALNLPEPARERAAPQGGVQYGHLLLELGFDAGLGGRLSSNGDFLRDQQLDFVYAFSGFFEFDRAYALGLGFERAGLGEVSSGLDAPSVRVSYGASTLWGALRAFPWRTDDVGVFAQLAVGASLQTVEADGITLDNSASVPAGVFVCDATGGPHFALGAGAGVDARIAPRVAFLAALGGAAYRLSDAVVGGCARGVGSTAALSARVGFAYHFDLGKL